ncbi:hypothetical protein ACTXT7_017313, partial [Hymenolepis weldensis]
KISLPDITVTNEMKRHAIIASLKAKQNNFEIARFLTAARSFVYKVRKELLNENNGDELVTMWKRKQYCQSSADSLRTSEFVGKEHGTIDENPGKSMHYILLKIFKCLKEYKS